MVAGVLTWLAITLLGWSANYRLSLAGVAGLIVAIGQTADSFIVYFERIRDEIRSGRSIPAAVDHGWQRARQTVLASKAVNLLAAAVLYFVAVGDGSGRHVFSRSLVEHNAAVREYLRRYRAQQRVAPTP